MSEMKLPIWIADAPLVEEDGLAEAEAEPAAAPVVVPEAEA